MLIAPAPRVPPHCPNPGCKYHERNDGWRWVRDGFFDRLATPHRIQRFRCRHCGRRCSAQTFHVTCWLRRPGLVVPVFHGLGACGGLRQLARSFHASPQTIQHHKRETIAYAKRRQMAINRLWVFLTWRNWCKWFSENRHEDTPAMRAGLGADRLDPTQILKQRLFVTHARLPDAWKQQYWGQVPTRLIPSARSHRLRYAT